MHNPLDALDWEGRFQAAFQAVCVMQSEKARLLTALDRYRETYSYMRRIAMRGSKRRAARRRLGEQRQRQNSYSRKIW